MDSINPHHGDLLIAQLNILFTAIERTDFPELIEERVTDDGEIFDALRCPRCGDLVDPEDLFAISFAQWWAEGSDISTDNRVFDVDWADAPDFNETLYYSHGDAPGHAVSLPSGWTEE